MNNSTKFELAKKDQEILEILQNDARLSNAQVAELTDTSASSCWRKIRAMEEAGIIQRYTAVVDPKKVGLQFGAIVQVQLDRHNTDGVEQLMKLLHDSHEVIECYATTGTYDYHIRVMCEDIESYNYWMETTMFPSKSIRHMQTNVILSSIKVSSPLRWK